MVPVMSGGHILPAVYGVQYLPVFFNGRLLAACCWVRAAREGHR